MSSVVTEILQTKTSNHHQPQQSHNFKSPLIDNDMKHQTQIEIYKQSINMQN